MTLQGQFHCVELVMCRINLPEISGNGHTSIRVSGPLLPLFSQLFYLVSVGLCVAVIVAFRLPAFTFRENLAATALLLVLFG